MGKVKKQYEISELDQYLLQNLILIQIISKFSLRTPSRGLICRKPPFVIHAVDIKHQTYAQISEAPTTLVRPPVLCFPLKKYVL